MPRYAIGLDYGTNSVRCLIVDIGNGAEVGTHVYPYESGEAGILLDRRDPDLARQNPKDYLKGAEVSVPGALKDARAKNPSFKPGEIIGIGVDTTGSTPLPVDEKGTPLAFQDRFAKNLNAMAWLWKDHTSHEEARMITRAAAEQHPEYLAKCGGTYSSEWFFSKILHCLRTDPAVFDAAHTWVECADWIPAVLTGTAAPGQIKRCICAAGHKGMFNRSWGGYPAKAFLAGLDPKLGTLRERLPNEAFAANQAVGGLTAEWAEKLGLPKGLPVAVGAFDAHLGAVGSGIKPGTLVKIMGTSTCDMMVVPLNQELADVPGLCGIVEESILPGHYGLEAGQSAVGDIFNWFVNHITPNLSHEELTKKAAALKPGESGLLALDWNNGNRTVLVDQRLTGLLLGQTLHTRPEEIYRALVEATAFGALIIMERFEEYGVRVEQVINCGGIAEKNAMVMQIYADITGRPMKVSRSPQTCALGAAIAGSVVAGKGGHGSFEEAVKAMTGVKDTVYKPNPDAQRVYKKIFGHYRTLHDAFGTENWQGNLYGVMKGMLEVRDEAR